MPSWLEFRLACRGVLLLAQFDAGFLRYFDRSATGALRSFWLILFLLPFELLSSYLMTRPLPSTGLFLAADTVGYLLGWILFPMVLLIIERTLDRAREVPGCIAVLNWFTLLVIALQLPGLLLIIIDPASGVAGWLFLLAFLFSIAIEAFLLMRCLRISLWQAAALVAVDALISIALGHLILALGHVPSAPVS